MHARGRRPSGALLIGGPHRLRAERRLARRRLNVLAGVEVLRRIAAEGQPPRHRPACQLGRRGGRALRPLASSARAPPPGSMDDQDELRRGRTPTGSRSRTRSASTASTSTARSRRAAQLETAAAYLELHIEQGPVLESMDLPLGVVLGTFGVERHQVTWHGPGRPRRLDADGQAPRRAGGRAPSSRSRSARSPRSVETAPSARRAASSASRESSPLSSRPPSSSSTSATWTRESSPSMLARGEGGERALRRARRTSRSSGSGSGRSSRSSSTTTLIELADEAVREVAGASHRLPSGPLHDAAEVARAGVPTVMLFVQSLRGLSHTKLEDTKPEHLELSVAGARPPGRKTIEHVAG